MIFHSSEFSDHSSGEPASERARDPLCFEDTFRASFGGKMAKDDILPFIVLFSISTHTIG